MITLANLGGKVNATRRMTRFLATRVSSWSLMSKWSCPLKSSGTEVTVFIRFLKSPEARIDQYDDILEIFVLLVAKIPARSRDRL
jgi:hypothetical protein